MEPLGLHLHPRFHPDSVRRGNYVPEVVKPRHVKKDRQKRHVRVTSLRGVKYVSSSSKSAVLRVICVVCSPIGGTMVLVKYYAALGRFLQPRSVMLGE